MATKRREENWVDMATTTMRERSSSVKSRGAWNQVEIRPFSRGMLGLKRADQIYPEFPLFIRGLTWPEVRSALFVILKAKNWVRGNATRFPYICIGCDALK